MTANSVAPVVVGVDGSPSSTQAVRLAGFEAATQRRPLCMLHAFNWIPAYPAAGGGYSRLAAEQLLQSAERQAKSRAPDVEATAEIVEGSAIEALLHASRDAALVVVGDGNLAAYVSLPVEATATRVAVYAECSVMLARDAEETPGPVLVGVDGTAGGDQALAFAFEAAVQRDTGLVVMQVVEPEDGALGDAQVAHRDATVTQWRQKYPGVPVRQRQVAGDPGHLLVEGARGASLAVVGARGQRPSHGLLGPVCLSVLHHAPCPVAVVRGRPHPAGS